MQLHPASCHHAVHFYRDDSDACARVAAYVTSGLRRGEHALLIAKPSLMRQVKMEVHRQHLDEPFGPERGQLACLDAAETLASLSIRGRPDQRLFDRTMAKALAGLLGTGRRIAAYGEMVDILCERGQFGEAVRLEQMWNGLLAKLDASLLCGYSRHVFKAPGAQAFFDLIRQEHGHVSPDSFPAPLEA